MVRNKTCRPTKKLKMHFRLKPFSGLGLKFVASFGKDFILPFKNFSGKSSFDSFAVGFDNWSRTRFVEFNKLSPRSATTVLPFQ